MAGGITVTPQALLDGSATVQGQGQQAVTACLTSLAGAVTNLESGASTVGGTAANLLASWQGGGSNAYQVFETGLTKDIGLINAAMNDQVRPAVLRIQSLFDELASALKIAGTSYAGTDAEIQAIFLRMASGT